MVWYGWYGGLFNQRDMASTSQCSVCLYACLRLSIVCLSMCLSFPPSPCRFVSSDFRLLQRLYSASSLILLKVMLYIVVMALTTGAVVLRSIFRAQLLAFWFYFYCYYYNKQEPPVIL